MFICFKQRLQLFSFQHFFFLTHHHLAVNAFPRLPQASLDTSAQLLKLFDKLLFEIQALSTTFCYFHMSDHIDIAADKKIIFYSYSME